MTNRARTTPEEADPLPSLPLDTPNPSSALATRQDGSVPAIAEGPGALLSAIVSLAKDPAFDVTKLQALMAMQERLEDRQAERAFAEALTAAQSEMPQVERLGTVSLGTGKGSYNFARLEDMDRVLRPIMIRHGFSIFFDREQREGAGGGLVVTGTLAHVAGHSKKASFPVALDTGAGRNNLQAAGSADSYARRYLIEGFFLIVRKGKDDDAHLAGVQFIDRAKGEQIEALLTETKSDRARFMQHFEIANILNLTTDAATPAFNMLLSKVAPDRRAAWQDAIVNGGIPA